MAGGQPGAERGNVKGAFVDVAVRITPRLSELAGADRRLRVAELALGGVPRGAVALLCRPGDLTTGAVELVNGLAEHGYESVAADLSATDVEVLTDDVLRQGVRLLLDRLAKRGWELEQIGLLGYGLGGRAALLAAADHVLGAAVSVDPAGIASPAGPGLPALLRSPHRVVTPWLGMFGQDDPATDASHVRELGAGLVASSPVFTQVVAYPGVSGDFYLDTHGALAHAASYDSWQRVVEWLNARVVPRPTPLARAWQDRRG